MATSKDLGRVRLVWHGEYDEETQYTYLDAVSYEGSSYMCFTETPPPVGTLPTDEDYFLVLAEKGSPSDATENGYLWLKESGSVVQCYPVPESELDLKVYFAPVETPPEEGEKGPENPSTISGWDSVEVVRCGKNVLNIHTDEVTPEWVTIENDTIRVEPVTTSAVSFPRNEESTYPRDTRVTLSAMRNKEYAGRIYAFYGASCFDQDWSDNKLIRSMTTVGNKLAASVDKHCLRIYQAHLGSSTNLVLDEVLELKNMQIEIGDTATTYEPYIGDTYTITLPDTFYGGYVDFERGVLVQTHQKITFDGTENWDYLPTAGIFQYAAPLLIGDYFPINNFFTQGVHPADTTEVCVTANGGYDATGRSRIAVWHVGEQLGYTTIDAWKTYLAQLAAAGNPLEVVYELFTPIEHPLEDLVPIKALTQTDRYTSQLNTVYANTNGDIELGYAKSPIKEHLDLINAITATGGANV